jgi:hypothetical protein
MPRPLSLVPRALTALAAAAMLGFGAHAAMASPAAFPCSGSGYSGLTCPVGPTGDAYCAEQCRRDFGPDSGGECWPGANSESPGCCVCLI